MIPQMIVTLSLHIQYKNNLPFKAIYSPTYSLKPFTRLIPKISSS